MLLKYFLITLYECTNQSLQLLLLSSFHAVNYYNLQVFYQYPSCESFVLFKQCTQTFDHFMQCSFTIGALLNAENPVKLIQIIQSTIQCCKCVKIQHVAHLSDIFGMTPSKECDVKISYKVKHAFLCLQPKNYSIYNL